MRSLPFLGLLAFTSTTIGCASSSSSTANHPPVIDDLEMPDTATIGPSGSYELHGKITAHDDDGTLASARVDIAGFAAPTIDAHHLQRVDGQPFVLEIDAHAAKGKLDYTFVLTDDEGAQAKRALSVTLQ